MSVTTIKKINPPYCPVVHGPCLGASCALYNDDVSACALSADSLQLLVRTAVTDAAVEITKHLGDDLK